MEFESRVWEDNADREKTGTEPSKSVPALDCNQPFPSSVSTFRKEARGFLWLMHQRDRTLRKDKNWYAGRVRTRTSKEEEEEKKKAGGFPDRLEMQRLQDFPVG